MTATKTTRDVLHGALLEDKGDWIVVKVPGTDYQMHLAPKGRVTPGVGGQVSGRVHCQAHRLDRMKAGGRFIEPVYGRPRTLQGTVVSVDATANTVTLHCPAPFIATFTADQRASDFAVGELVGCHIERGATFEPIAT
ncbi:MAG: hypothetical protein GC164_03670 [Phycisphaera sp.]|nr:hypothetical protein [Phycisphaera sp.]